MSNEKLREAFELGWKMAANWSLSDHLLADMESPAYLTERDGLLQALATTEPEPTGMPEVKPWDHPEPQTMRWSDLEIRWIQSYGEQCWKAGYKHGAWGGDARDAERYRWLRDDTDSDWAICEWSHDPGDEGYYRDARAPHIVDAAIDAAMAQGAK